MKSEMIIILSILLVGLFSVSAVAAAENLTDNFLSDNDTTGSFDELYELVESGSYEISLDKNYILDSDFESDYIYLSEGQVFDGNGHSIDGNKHPRIFYSDEDDITIKNLVIKNTQHSEDEYYGPIYFEGNNCRLDNCTFINNNGETRLIEFECYGVITNCKFTSNNMDELVSISSDKFSLSNCEFSNNKVHTVIYGSDASVEIDNCRFNNNVGCLIKSKVDLTNSNFNNNRIVEDYQTFIEASQNSRIENCNFNGFRFSKDKENPIMRLDGGCTVSDCSFTNNNVTYCIDISYDNSKDYILNCRFENNYWDGYLYGNSKTVVQNPTFSNNKIRSSILCEFSGIVYDYKYELGVTFLDTNGNPVANKKVTYVLGGKTKTATTDQYGFFVVVNKEFGKRSAVLTNPVTNEKLTRGVTIYKIFDNYKDVTKYYKSPTTYKVRVFDFNGKIAKGTYVQFRMGSSYSQVKTDKNGYATLKLNQKPGKYTLYAQCAGYYITSKIKIKSTIVTKDLTKKVKKPGKFNVKILNSKGKAFAKQAVKIKFKGKSYSLKTNNKGIASFNIPTNLKAGKYVIKTTYNGYTASNKIILK